MKVVLVDSRSESGRVGVVLEVVGQLALVAAVLEGHGLELLGPLLQDGLQVRPEVGDGGHATAVSQSLSQSVGQSMMPPMNR